MRKRGKERRACRRCHFVCNRKVAHNCLGKRCPHFARNGMAQERRRRLRHEANGVLRGLCREIGICIIVKSGASVPENISAALELLCSDMPAFCHRRGLSGQETGKEANSDADEHSQRTAGDNGSDQDRRKMAVGSPRSIEREPTQDRG